MCVIYEKGNSVYIQLSVILFHSIHSIKKIHFGKSFFFLSLLCASHLNILDECPPNMKFNYVSSSAIFTNESMYKVLISLEVLDEASRAKLTRHNCVNFFSKFD